MILTLLLACEPHCVGDDCEPPEEVPWDPGEGGDEGDGYGYGGSGDTGEDEVEEEVEREIVSVRDCDVTYAHIPSGDPSSVQIAGEFNGWTPTDLAEGSDGAWSVSLGELDPGEYAFKLLYDGSWEGDPPVNVYTKWSDGSENRNLRVGDCTLPLIQTVSVDSGSDWLSAEFQVASAADGAAIDPDRITLTVGGDEVTPTVDVEQGTVSVSLSGLSPDKYSLRLWVTDEAGRAAENDGHWVPLWVEAETFEWADGLIYFAFVDRFRNGDYGASGTPEDPVGWLATCSDWNGGDYLGVRHALEEDYFEALGANILWLNPVYDNTNEAYLGTDGSNWFSGYHGYWPIDPLAVEEQYGSNEASADQELRALIDEAHSRGIRVLFDLVLNHVHEDHSYIDEHPDWFGDGCVCGSDGCGWDDKPVECWFTDYLPDLDYKNHAITERVLDDTLELLATYDIDAVRVDAAKHMDHVIMRSLRKRLDEEVSAGGGASFYVVGETYTDSNGHSLIMDYVGDHELSAQFDFPLYYALRDTFAYGGSFNSLESSVATSESWYGDALMSPFLGNHDVSRFASEVTGATGDCWSEYLEDPMAYGGDLNGLIEKAAMGLAFTLTQPGVPLLYYGDEIGLHGGGDPDNRRMMSFEPYLSADQQDLLGRIQAIGQARADNVALRRGERTQLWVEDDFLAYALVHDDQAAVVAMNKGGWRSESIGVDWAGVPDGTYVDAISGQTATVSSGTLDVTLDSWAYGLWVQQ